MRRPIDTFMVLRRGETYNVAWYVANLLGWTEDGDSTGYNVADYFDSDGRYKGPDKYGIEPLFPQTVPDPTIEEEEEDEDEEEDYETL